MKRARITNERARPRGFTLLELSVSSAAAGLLMVGLAAAIAISARAAQYEPTTDRDWQLFAVYEQFSRDIETATSLTSYDRDRWIEFTVPDRDGDNIEETIRYERVGPTDDYVLQYTFNGGTPSDLTTGLRQSRLRILNWIEAPDASGDGSE